ncbi:hypothetical protein Dda_9306 [Drechslerella dactyloides]|uniref:NACHT domain-containing protein n=1 Tax=Drechslerella dactyloides TaxID=74499 RepID=A0AAD6NFD2_DREDA|nr:hypothetical protein Dda_9306 [Drechslerella dactyloides]
MVNLRGAAVLLADRLLHNGIVTNINREQWKLEVVNWLKVAITGLKLSVVQYGTGKQYQPSGKTFDTADEGYKASRDSNPMNSRDIFYEDDVYNIGVSSLDPSDRQEASSDDLGDDISEVENGPLSPRRDLYTVAWEWQKYAAATAAAYAKELLDILPASEIPGNAPYASEDRRKARLIDELSHRRGAAAREIALRRRHPDYRAWLDPKELAEHRGFLWIRGKPGAAAIAIPQNDFVSGFRVTDWISNAILFAEDEECTSCENLLYVLAKKNLGNLIRIHPQRTRCFDFGSTEYGPPLFAALASGSHEAVQAFLEGHAQVQLGGHPFNLCKWYTDNENKRIDWGPKFSFSRQRGIASHIIEKGDEVIFAFSLISGYIDYQAKGEYGQTPLSSAAYAGWKTVVQLLLERGVDIESGDNGGRTPLIRAASAGRDTVVQMLLKQGAEIECRDNSGRTPLSWAAVAGREAVVRLLLATERIEVDSKDKYGRTPLWYASESGDTGVVQLLLDNGADIESKDNVGQTPLSHAASLRRGSVVQLLLEKGVDVESRDKNGQTPLSHAAVAGAEEVIRLLLEKGVNIESRDKNGQTPLSHAACSCVPEGQHGGVIQWDFGKTGRGAKFERIGLLNKPPTVLTAALSKLSTDHELEGSMCSEFISDMLRRYPKLGSKYGPRGSSTDILYEAHYDHAGELPTCEGCDPSKIVHREPREEGVVVHYGLIASGNQVMKHGLSRDEISRSLGGALCFEMEAAGIMNDFPCVVIRGICDYSDSHKNKAWQEYAAATAAAFARELLHTIPTSQVAAIKKVEEVLSGIKDTITDAVKQINDEGEARATRREEDKLIQMLFKSGANYMDQISIERIPDRVAGTCQWFLRNRNYIEWLENKRSSLLWVSADPGCGKSVLAASLLRRELAKTKTRTTCYFFFKDDDADRRSAAVAISAILCQLFSQNKDLRKYAMSHFAEKGAKLTENVGVLWEILTKAAADPKAGEIICVLDALDECEESQRIRIINLLREYYSVSGHPDKLKFLVTSRPYFDIERGFRKLTNDFPTIRLAAEEEAAAISREIDLVIKYRVGDLKTEMDLPEPVAAALEASLLKMTHRTYLYLKLIFEVIRNRFDATTEKRMRGILEQMPKTVDKAYEEILNGSSNPVEAKRLLHFVVAAVRPLSLKEMGLALAIDGMTPAPTCYEDLDLEAEHLFRTRIRNTCGLFINIVDSKIYLLHQTAKEFLVRAGSEATFSGSWKQCLIPRDSSLMLAKACLTYLLFDVFESDPPQLPEITEFLFADPSDMMAREEGVDQPESEDEKRKQELEALYEEVSDRYRKLHGFLDYAATSWFHHVRDTDDPEIMAMTVRILEKGSKRMYTWSHMDLEGEEGSDVTAALLSPLGVAVSFRLPSVVKIILDNGCDLKERDAVGMTALSYAVTLTEPENPDELTIRQRARPHSWEILCQLLAHMADKAAEKRPRELMLEVEYKDVEARPAYSIAKGGSGRPGLLGILGLERQKTPEDLLHEPRLQKTAILALLQNVVGVNLEILKERDGLHLEAQACFEVIVGFLTGMFEEGEDVDEDGSEDARPPHPVVAVVIDELGDDFLDIVEARTDANSHLFSDGVDQNDAVELLVELGETTFHRAAEVCLQGAEGLSRLEIAARLGRQFIGVLLLAAYNFADHVDGYSPMDPLDYLYYLSVKYRYSAIFQILLANGPEAIDFSRTWMRNSNIGNRLLGVSIAMGDVLTTRVLLEEGANPDSMISSINEELGLPAVLLAIILGEEEILKVFIQRGANIDAAQQNGLGVPTALHMAAAIGEVSMCKLLLDHGANANVPGPEFRVWEALMGELVAYFEAVSGNIYGGDGGDDDQAQEADLSDQEELVMEQRILGGTVLHLAVATGFTELIELLASSKVDIKVKNQAGKTAVLVAKDTGNREIIRLVEGIARKQRGKIVGRVLVQ